LILFRSDHRLSSSQSALSTKGAENSGHPRYLHNPNKNGSFPVVILDSILALTLPNRESKLALSLRESVGLD